VSGGSPIGTERYIGMYRGGESGPRLICTGGLHGNEPAGVEALRRVCERLARERPPFRGELVALVGNRPALRERRRYLWRDLNRIWTLDRIRALRNGVRPGGDGGWTEETEEGAETREQAELLAELDRLLDPGRDDIYCLDLHTTSSESVPFATFSDTLRNRALARHYPVPLILGLEEELEGTLLDYVNHLGHVALGVEGGQHDAPESVDRLEAAVWLALVAIGSVRLEDVPHGGDLRARLRRAVRNVPRLFEVRYRHALRAGDEFRMGPEFRNFQEVTENEPVARDRRGEIRAPESGRIFLPLYQEQGEEGFFIVREVAPVWLRISALLRRLDLDLIAPVLPGVEEHPERERTIVVHPRVARPVVVSLFHLLGYRRERPEGEKLVLSRRKEQVQRGDGTGPAG